MRAADPMTAMPHVRIEAVSKSFGSVPALAEVSLDLDRQELFCLLGGSGCGKTTLLRLLAGFDEPSAGRILIDGVDMRGIPPYARSVNMMFQSYALFPHMTVFDNIAFGLRRERRSRAEIRTRVAAMLELVKLDGYGQRRPQQLSGGQQQRVALARALIKQPKLLLLDEPLAALDRKLREATQFELKNIQATLGVTFVMVTHDQQEAMTLGTRMGVMNQGRLVQTGVPSEIYRKPANRFVADFIGAVNLFAGQVQTCEHNEVAITVPAAASTLRARCPRELLPAAPVWLAVRPEEIDLHPVRTDHTEDNWLRGRITHSTDLGGHSLIKVALADGFEIKVTQASAASAPATPHTPGHMIWLRWPVSVGVVLST